MAEPCQAKAQAIASRAAIRQVLIIRLLVVGPDPSISGVLARNVEIEISRLGFVEDVARKRAAPFLDVHAVDAGSIQAKNLGLVFFGDLGIAEFLAKLIADLERFKGTMAHLCRAPPMQLVTQGHVATPVDLMF